MRLLHLGGSMNRLSIATSVIWLVLATNSMGAASATWTVDDNGGADFVHIQDAVDAAQSGDVIVVEHGAYAGFTVDGKSLVVAGQPGGDVVVGAFVVVKNLGAAQKVELDHLKIGQTFMGVEAPTLALLDNAGSVRVVDCEILGYSGGCHVWCGYGSAAVQCRDSSNVGVLRSTLSGGDGGYYGLPGLSAALSNVTITDSTLVGGEGNGGPLVCNGYAGGAGALITESSTVVSNGSTFGGGPGGEEGGLIFGCPSFPPEDGPRGAGIEVLSGSTGRWRASTFNEQPGPETGAFEHTAFAAFCFGTWEECPCGNNGAVGAGCETSYGSGGARLSAAGTPSVSADTLTLHATGLHANANPAALFFQGDSRVNGGMGAPFNDGLLCTDSGIRRLKGKLSSGGSVSFGFGLPNDGPVSVRGQVPASGGTRVYQVWFRHQASQYCTPERLHMSNAVEVTWLP
jgi:hypothetical protein